MLNDILILTNLNIIIYVLLYINNNIWLTSDRRCNFGWKWKSGWSQFDVDLMLDFDYAT